MPLRREVLTISLWPFCLDRTSLAIFLGSELYTFQQLAQVAAYVVQDKHRLDFTGRA